MKQLVITCAVFCLVCSAAGAGVVVEMEVQGGEKETVYAHGEMARMDSHAGGDDMSMIFRDETFWFLDHAAKTGQKIDEQGMSELTSQLAAVMKQLEQLPPQQREMMEKMMKGKMPGGMGEEPPPQRIDKGAAEQVGEYRCTVHTLYSGEEKVWEVCSADEGVEADMAEAMGAFRAMSQFAEKLQEALGQGPLAGMMKTPFSKIDDLNGFPVRVRSYDSQGRLVRESTLKSITRQDVDETIFEVPKGYKVKDLAKEMNRGR